MARRRVKALLLAAGLGTRLRPLTDSTPKCLAPIGGRPLLQYWVDLLEDAEIREARVNTHAFPEQVRASIDQINQAGGVQLSESYEPRLLGSAGTVAANAALADEADEVVVVYSDNLSDVDLGALLEFHRSHDGPFTMLLFRAADPRACGIAELDREGRVVSFAEKPCEPRGDLANAGVYVVDSEAYREIAALRAFDLGYDVLPTFVGRMRGWVWSGYHRDVGTPEALRQAQRDAPTLSAARIARAGGRPAVFLDRDGTLIEHVHYLADRSDVRLLAGAAEALRSLRRAGFACVLVTNQAAIGRGLLTEEGLEEIHEELKFQLSERGAGLDALYHCPVTGKGADRSVVEHHDRKPGPGMLLRAAADLDLDLSASWMIGDAISDALAGRNAGCRGSLLVRTGKGVDESNDGRDFETCDDVLAAARLLIGSLRRPADHHQRELTHVLGVGGIEGDRR